MTRSVREKMALVAIGTLAGLVMVEVVLWVLGLPRFYAAHTNPGQFRALIARDGTATYRNDPATQIAFTYDGDPRGYFGPGNTVRHTTNAEGFRGRNLTGKLPGVVRIAFLGDSVTFGEGVKDDDVFAQVAPRLLTERHRREGLFFEGLNFGVGGYNTRQEVDLLKSAVLATDPDVIVLVYTPNDAEPELLVYDTRSKENRRRDREGAIPEGVSESRPPSAWIYRSRLARMLWKFVRQRERAARTMSFYSALYGDDREGWRVTQESLREFAGVCRQHRITCMVATFPLLYRLDERHPFRSIHEEVRAAVGVTEGAGLAFVDLLPAFLSRDDRALWVHPTDQHPNEIAHRIAAEALVPAIEALLGLRASPEGVR